MAERAAKRRKLDIEDSHGAEGDYAPVEIHSSPDNYVGGLFNMVFVDGDAFPKFPVSIPLEEHIRKLRTLPMREDDVVITAFPSSGARWIWEVTRMLLSGNAEYDPRSKEHATLELNDNTDIEYGCSPRVFTSHLFLRQLSEDIVTQRSRIVHVTRNPKDLVVSYYFRMRQMSLFQDNGFHDFAENFLNSSGCQGTVLDYFTYLHEMTNWQRHHPQVPVLQVHYEDMIMSPVQSVHRLARFLQLNHVSDALCADIADQCSFHNLKEASQQMKARDHPSRILFKDYNPIFFRKGEIGDWKNYFTMALSEQYDQVLGQRLQCHGFSFQYTAA